MEEAFNPDTNKEVVIGLLMGGLVMIGLVLELFGVMIVFFNRFMGNILWLVGTSFLVFTIIINIRSKHGKGFRIANIVIKGVMLLIFTILVIIGNLAPR